MNEMVMKVDELGRPAWIGLMVLGFIVFWPIGLAILAFLLWSGRMGCGPMERGRWPSRFAERAERRAERWRSEARGWGDIARGYASSGNRAFDEYRDTTLKRLEDEQREFKDFLERLRMAKDRSEFDQFVADRKSRGETGARPDPGPAAA